MFLIWLFSSFSAGFTYSLYHGSAAYNQYSFASILNTFFFFFFVPGIVPHIVDTIVIKLEVIIAVAGISLEWALATSESEKGDAATSGPKPG